MKKMNTAPISGMQELLPPVQAVFNQLKNNIQRTFTLHGFQNIETAMIERTEILLAKAGGDTEKQIYKVVKTAETADDASQALRFDHTVPLARYVVEHQNDLAFPFRVSQVGRNFRGERAQKGRFREFYQLDADVIGRGSLPIAYDADTIATLYRALAACDLPKIRARISNRKLLTGLLTSLGLSQLFTAISGIIDHAEKVPPTTTQTALLDLGLSRENVAKITTFMQINGPRNTAIAQLHALDCQDPTFQAGLKELDSVLTFLAAQGLEDAAVIDLMIVRGLDYYTGTVFEFILPDYKHIGSICGGGRYENLASNFSAQKLPGVGGSIGLTRLFYVLNAENLLRQTTSAPLDVAIIPLSAAAYDTAFTLVAQLRQQGKSSDLVLTDKKLSEKMSYASKVAAAAVVIGEDEIKNQQFRIKDFATGRTSDLVL